jgi:hypothetical protein
MRTIRVLTLVAGLLLPLGASAKTPAGQGRPCDARNKCDAGLQCVPKYDGKSTCEVVCASNTKCPEDQRCVKDGPQSVCRPIMDGDL